MPERQPPAASLTIAGLTKSYGGVQVLKGIDLAVAPGEFISLVGPSGCGKTTTLNIIAGFEAPNGGDIRIDATSIVKLPSYRRDLGMVFQSHALFPHLTVAENIGFGLLMRKRPKSEIARQVGRALEMVRLSGFQNRYPRELSGGQQQRIGLARALTVEPRIILLDEPLSSLDAKLRREMQFEIRQIQQEVKTTAIYVTHDQEEALTMSDRIVLMNKGVVEQVGSPIEVYSRPTSEFSAAFIGHASFFDGKVVDAATGRVALDGGIFAHATHCRSRTAGEQVRLAVRPDRVHLDLGDGDFAGTLLTRAFVGPTLYCEVALPGGTRLQAHVPARADFAASAGDRVSIRIEPQDWLVIQAGAR
ncbi:ABC transporter ATP-binding protein [Bosea thiooxidans]|nr:ABC transporter ATP-binding protein [Bosea sp. (in: a-proteobacteria)]